MDKDKIFSKLAPKDYNNELEKILEEKDFSTNAKNLLLSMLYKIEAGYKDYSTVKVMVERKNEYIEKLLEIIKQDLKQIIIITRANEDLIEDEEEIKKNKYIVSPIEGKIELFYPNEKNLLYAIFELNSTSIYFTEEYNLCRISLSELLNIGENMNNVEVLRDFNGWSWTIQEDEIKNLWINLIYQNLIYLLGFDEITKWIHQTKIPNYVQIIETKIKERYGEKISENILKLICKLSIIICTQTNNKEKERLLQEKQYLEEDIEKLSNRAKLVEEITKQKKELLNEIKEIDKILNDDELLQEEFIARNEKLPEYNKIFSLLHLSEILSKQRKKKLAIIEENNKLLQPNHFVNLKIQKDVQYDLLKTINFKLEDQICTKEIIELQKLFIKCLEIKIQNISEKNETINLIYMLRYYSFLPIEEHVSIKEINELKQYLENIQAKIIEKAIEQKILIKISEDENINKIIYMNIFNTRIIKLENINMEISGGNIKLYDDNILEKEISLTENIYEEKLKIKINKIFKIFM